MQGFLLKKKKKNRLKNKVKILRKDRREQIDSEISTKLCARKNKNFKVCDEPLVKHHDGQKWFEYQVDEKISDTLNDTLGTKELLALEEEADILLEADFDLHNKYMQTQGGSEAVWLQTIIKKGTASDRMTAMQVQLHKSPVHSLCYIEIMIGSLEKKNTRESLELLPLLEDMFLNYILPTNRKLIPFSGRPLKRIEEICSNSERGRKRVLILWRFEHRLKLVYERFLRALEGLASVMAEDLCKKALQTALNLLAERPEGEKILLSMLVNKLGHPKYHIGAFVATLLENLTKLHPNMRPVIVTEVERLIYRSNVSQKAHLYAISFLSQITLRTGESDLAAQMLSIYFGLFKTLVNQKFPNNRLIGILLSASNRALPFAKEKADCLTEEINTLYRIVHTSSYTVALQTLKLLYTVHEISESLSERFYTALYRKLLIDVPHSCYNQLLLLLFKVLRSDPSEFRVRSFVKRLLQAATGATPSLAAGILILISRLLESRENLIVLRKNVNRLDSVSTRFPNGDIEDDERYVDIGVDGKPVIGVKEEKGHIDYEGDPLDDFTLMKFLDRFAFKNPKERLFNKSATNCVIRRKQFDPWGVKKFAVSSKEYLSKKTTELPADEQYLHRFVSLKFNPDGSNRKKDKDDEWEIESVDSAEFDALIDKFEPGEGKDDFDVDYSKEFTSEKKKSNVSKRSTKNDNCEDDEVDFDINYDDDSDEDGDDSDGDSENDDEIGDLSDFDDNNEDNEMQSESDEEDSASASETYQEDDLSDDDDSECNIGLSAANDAGEKFASLLEDFEEEEKAQPRNRRKNKRRKLNGGKRKIW